MSDGPTLTPARQMSRIPVLGIPHFNRPDLLRRCIASIDYPVALLVIIQNGPDDQMPTDWEGISKSTEELIEDVNHIRHPNPQSGVAGAWNEIIKLHPAPWWLIANNDIQFAPGDLKRMAAAAWRNEAMELNAGKFFGNHGASFFAITQYGVDTVGLFDENFYPAYLEDCDWHYRAKLLDVDTVNVEGCRAIHGDGTLTGSCTVNSTPVLREKNVHTHSQNFGYYEAKWGGRNGEETFDNPFNDLGWPVWAWRFDTRFRRAQLW